MRPGALNRIAVTAAALALLSPATFAPKASAADSPPMPAALPTLRMGSHGPAVLQLQEQLRNLKFNTPAGGFYDDRTRAAVWAFQRVNGLPKSDTAGPELWKKLQQPSQIRILVPRGTPNRVEINLRQQVMAVYRGGRPALITHISSGARRHYCYHGHCGFARTPLGNFRVFKKIGRWRKGPLGAMYRPLYFHGGTAMHGSTLVPNHPASHGCIRIPMHNATLVYHLVKKGTQVHIRQTTDIPKPTPGAVLGSSLP